MISATLIPSKPRSRKRLAATLMISSLWSAITSLLTFQSPHNESRRVHCAGCRITSSPVVFQGIFWPLAVLDYMMAPTDTVATTSNLASDPAVAVQELAQLI